MDLTVNRIATEAYVSPIQPIKPVTSNAERAEIADRLKQGCAPRRRRGRG